MSKVKTRPLLISSSKLGIFSGDEVCRILETHGFRRVRHRGYERNRGSSNPVRAGRSVCGSNLFISLLMMMPAMSANGGPQRSF
jgi:hypothetical protein